MSKARDLADSAQEINILDGKSFLDEDNLASDSATGIASQQSIKAYVDGITTTNITSTGALNSGSITSGFGNINNGSSTITTTGAITGGSFVIGSADINENDLESIDGITAGTVSASKAVVVNTDKDITGFRNITATGTITGSLSGTLSGSLSSTTTATTQAESDDSTKIATTAYVTDKITTLIGGAPSTLNDLNELAAAINDDANYNSTLTTALGTKLPKAGGTMTGDVLYNDNVKAKFGAGSDLQIYHDGSNSYISDQGTGHIKILANDFRVVNASNTEQMITANQDGSVTLYNDSVAKLATTSTGIDVTGTVANSSGNLTLDANAEMIFDSNGANWRLKDNGTQILHISRPTGQVKFFASVQDSDIVFGGMDGTSPITALTLDMSDAGKATFNNGLIANGDISLGDSKYLLLGNANDFQIFHNGADSYLFDNGTGNLNLTTNGASINLRKHSGGENMLVAVPDGSVSLYHNNSKKIETTSSGISVTGTVAATSYTGDGSNLTGISSGAITHLGTLNPTSSGTSLTLSSLNLSGYKQVHIFFENITANSTSSYITLNEGSSYKEHWSIGGEGISGDDKGSSWMVTCDLSSGVCYTGIGGKFNKQSSYWARGGTTYLNAGGNPNPNITTSTTSLAFNVRSGYSFYAGNGVVSGITRAIHIYGVA